MEKEYYQINYKSAPRGVGYIIEKEGNSINILNSHMPPAKLLIGLINERWVCSPVYKNPKKIDVKIAKALANKGNRIKLENALGLDL